MKTNPNNTSTMPQECTRADGVAGIESPTWVCRLKTEYPHGDGRVRRLIKRTAKTALYVLSRGDTTQGYEVIKIQVRQARMLFGEQKPATETYPSAEGFGKCAVSCATLERSEAYFELFEQGKSVGEAREELR